MEDCYKLYLAPAIFIRNTHVKGENIKNKKLVEQKIRDMIYVLYPEFRNLINTIEIDWDRKVVKINGKIEFMLLIAKDSEIE